MKKAISKNGKKIYYYAIVSENIIDDLLDHPAISRNLTKVVWTKADGSFLRLSVTAENDTFNEYVLIGKEKLGAVVVFDDNGTPRYRYDNMNDFLKDFDDFKAEEIWQYAKITAAQTIIRTVYANLRIYLIDQNSITVSVDIDYLFIKVTLVRKVDNVYLVTSSSFYYSDDDQAIAETAVHLADKMNAEIIKANGGKFSDRAKN